LPYHSRETSIRHPAHQPDADRRDAAIRHEDRRRAGGRSMEMNVIASDYEEVCILVEGRGGRDPEEAVEMARTTGLPLKAVPVVGEPEEGAQDVICKGLESNH
jgi:hypothetical protein